MLRTTSVHNVLFDFRWRLTPGDIYIMNIKAVALTEKGAVKPAVRKAIVEKIAKNPELFAEATKVGPSLYTLTATDSNGDNIYINFKISVGTLSADNYATKTKVTTTDEIVVE